MKKAKCSLGLPVLFLGCVLPLNAMNPPAGVGGSLTIVGNAENENAVVKVELHHSGGEAVSHSLGSVTAGTYRLFVDTAEVDPSMELRVTIDGQEASILSGRVLLSGGIFDSGRFIENDLEIAGGAFNEVFSGDMISPLSGETHSERHFQINVPPRQSTLEIMTFGGTGDLDLFVRFGHPASRRNSDYFSQGLSNDERIVINEPQEGVWYIMIYGVGTYSGASLGVAHTPVGRWGDAASIGDGWLYLAWFGRFMDFGNWIYHEEHGWWYIVGENPGDFYYYDKELSGWGWISPEVYPWLYWFDAEEWQRNSNVGASAD